MCQTLENAASQGLLALDMEAAEQELDGEQTCGLTCIKAACYACADPAVEKPDRLLLLLLVS